MIKKITFTLLAIFMFSSMSFAHMPQFVAVNYNSLTSILTAEIGHTTTNPNVHFVYKIDVIVNGRKVVSDDTIGGQPNGNGRTYTTRLNAKAGDVIEVIAYCNRKGQKNATIAVAQGAGKATTAVMEDKTRMDAIEKKMTESSSATQKSQTQKKKKMW
ncbi:MAG: hypothetical protein AB1650_04780 [Candidatus Omnitrophota bacterium]